MNELCNRILEESWPTCTQFAVVITRHGDHLQRTGMLVETLERRIQTASARTAVSDR
jgi:hypothetical protein